MDAGQLRDRLTRAGAQRVAHGLVADAEHTLEVSVAGSDRWVVRSWNREWTGGPDGVRCWLLVPAGGATEMTETRPDGWVHPVIGLFRPELLPIWGRADDAYAPVRVLEGVFGPAQVVLAAAGSREPVGTLHVDARRWLCTALELPDRAWSLVDYHSSG
ncbi:MAG TPA: hypothetical protein GXZ45_12270 [Propionibacterium sp.]|nr:hypothetical protein [Propionibacterium sp.]